MFSRCEPRSIDAHWIELFKTFPRQSFQETSSSGATTGKRWKTRCLRGFVAKKVMWPTLWFTGWCVSLTPFGRSKLLGFFCWLFVFSSVFWESFFSNLSPEQAEIKGKTLKKTLSRVGGCSALSALSHFNRWREKILQSDETLDSHLVSPDSPIWRFIISRRSHISLGIRYWLILMLSKIDKYQFFNTEKSETVRHALSVVLILHQS